MRIGVSMFLGAEPIFNTDRALAHVLAVGRTAEAAGLSGVWATDSLGRGHPTLDPLVALAALCGVTQRVEIGTCVLQVTLRPPVELAHRAQTLNVLSRGRLRLGVGVGSTKADFDAVGAEFDHRFERLDGTLEIMRAAWRGEPSTPGSAALFPWPGIPAGPPIFLGAWRKPHWITYAARRCEGWIASGMKSKWRDVEEGMRVFRAAEGKRAILANLPLDLDANPARSAQDDSILLVCSAATARERLKRLEQLGFDDVLLACPFGSTRHMDMIASLAQSL
jgi:alkanesulfonate monooxygenase SsuD/methylene tetrahydromethanopterin reductase-like flavin-dependent oxidoreductase (luciferase family)